MMNVGVPRRTSSLARIRASSSAVLFVTLLVPYIVDKDCIRESNDIIGRSIYRVV